MNRSPDKERTVAQIDYRNLLKRYMEHVHDEESSRSIIRLRNPVTKGRFTEAEIGELERIYAEVE